jgi:hypothetical protein
MTMEILGGDRQRIRAPNFAPGAFATLPMTRSTSLSG